MTTERRFEPASLYLTRSPEWRGSGGFDEILLVLAGAMVALAVSSAPASAEHFVPHLTYRTGPFAANGSLIANGFLDYMTMINERDGGIGGVKVKVEECKPVTTLKVLSAIIHQGPWCTGFSAELHGYYPAAHAESTTRSNPLLTPGYGLSAGADGEKFPWAFNFPANTGAKCPQS